ncbi:hypothetical protein L3X38_026448 [Prunus dulcis]|uniref:DUF3456 domain-containing protein n=1 Tax=Prunus dulcis TaxID=3755 RepID=A0AAD4YYH2_PRUDU|nr:hypothetical protein L3X38_026448 [Prunus dulcis]
MSNGDQQTTCGSMPDMSNGDHANTSLLFWRKAVSSTFSSKLRREPIRAFLFGLSGSKGTSLTSSSGFHPSSGVNSWWIPSSWRDFIDDHECLSTDHQWGVDVELYRSYSDCGCSIEAGDFFFECIPNRVSELRVVALLDGICERCRIILFTRKEWIKVDNWNNLTISKQEAKAYSKDLSTYCGRLLEETEDELAEMIKKGSERGGDVLCQDPSAHCSRTSASHQGNGYGNGSDGEL